MRNFLVFVSVLLLCSCAQIPKSLWSQPSPEEIKQIEEQQKIEAAKEREEENRKLQILVEEHYKPKCIAMGFKDEKDISQCVLTLITNDEQKKAVDKASRRAAAAAYLNSHSTTRCTGFGNTVQCNSY